MHTACAHTYTYTYKNTHNMQKRKHTDANRPNHCRNTANDQPIGMLKKCALPYMGLSTVVIYSCDQEQAGTSLIMRWAQCRHTLHLVPRGAIKAINTTTDSTTKWDGEPYYIKAINTTTHSTTIKWDGEPCYIKTISTTTSPSQPTLYQNEVDAQRG